VSNHSTHRGWLNLKSPSVHICLQVRSPSVRDRPRVPVSLNRPESPSVYISQFQSSRFRQVYCRSDTSRRGSFSTCRSDIGMFIVGQTRRGGGVFPLVGQTLACFSTCRSDIGLGYILVSSVGHLSISLSVTVTSNINISSSLCPLSAGTGAVRWATISSSPC